MPRGNIDNLVPNSEKTPEQRKEQARKAGIASGKAKRKKKLMASLYADMLVDKYDVVIDGQKKKIDGEKFFKVIARDVLLRRDSASVQMLKEIRDGNDNYNNEATDNELRIIIDDEAIDADKN